jgi:hypothetical protein
MNMEVPLSPGSILRMVWFKSFFFEALKECIYVSHVKDDSAPVAGRRALLQIEYWEFGARRDERAKTHLGFAVHRFHSENIAIEPHRNFD